MMRILRPGALVLALSLVATGPARGEAVADLPVSPGEVEEMNERLNRPAPVVLEVFTGEASLLPGGFGLQLGAHGWRGEHGYWAARLGGWRSVQSYDLTGDGTDDFSGSQVEGMLWHASVDLGRNIQRQLRPIVLVESGLSRVRTYADGSTETERLPADYVMEVETTSIISGLALAFGNGATQLGIPIGLRRGRHWNTTDRQFEESWMQARALLYLPALRPGLDAEYAWISGRLGLSVYAEWVPHLAGMDDGDYTCARQRDCMPDHPLTAFDREPLDGRITLGVRVRAEVPL